MPPVIRRWVTGYGENEFDTGIDIVWEEDTGGYDWTCYALLRREHGDTYQYAMYFDGGCSCNYPYEESPENYDLQWNFDFKKVAQDLAEAVRGSYSVTEGEKAEFIAQLRSLN